MYPWPRLVCGLPRQAESCVTLREQSRAPRAEGPARGHRRSCSRKPYCYTTKSRCLVAKGGPAMSMPHRVDDFWLPDDTEEDLVGADWHQYTIDVVYDGTRDVADLDHLPWHVGNQLTLVGWTPRGVWRPAPDIAIYPTAGPELRKEMSVKNDGPPTLVVEVASPSTWEYDINDVSGKAAGYLGLGVEYYLVFDPTGELL